jgi:type II secretory pathway component PulK
MNRRAPHHSPRTRRTAGSALIMTLWVLGLLALMVASFAFEAHIEARLTSFYRHRTNSRIPARSGLDVAELLVGRSQRLRGTERDPDKSAEDIWYDPAFTLADGER